MSDVDLTYDQILVEQAVFSCGTARRLSKITGLHESTISKYRNGKPIKDRKMRALFELALDNGILRQENSKLKRLKNEIAR